VTQLPVLSHTDARGVLTITLNRPDKHNALDADLITMVLDILRDCSSNPEVRVVVLTGAGDSFSAGADLNWMQTAAAEENEESLEDALGLAELLSRFNRLSKPTLAAVNGPAYGGGLGLIASCDIAIASTTATFALSEVRLGLVPAIISPYVIEAMGKRAARRYFLSGEPLAAEPARMVGLVHEVVEPNQLQDAVSRQVSFLLKGGPDALRECKELIALVGGADESMAHTLERRTAEIIAHIRRSDEAREGINAFLEKRPADWAH